MHCTKQIGLRHNTGFARWLVPLLQGLQKMDIAPVMIAIARCAKLCTMFAATQLLLLDIQFTCSRSRFIRCARMFVAVLMLSMLALVFLLTFSVASEMSSLKVLETMPKYGG